MASKDCAGCIDPVLDSRLDDTITDHTGHIWHLRCARLALAVLSKQPDIDQPVTGDLQNLIDAEGNEWNYRRAQIALGVFGKALRHQGIVP